MPDLKTDVDHWLRSAAQRVSDIDGATRVAHRGIVERVGDGVATVTGLWHTRLDELLEFDGGIKGIAINLERERIGCVLLGPDDGVAAGSPVVGTGEVARAPVGEALLGRVIDPLGRPIDGGPEIRPRSFESLEADAPAIIDRAPVDRPLHTGLTVIDSMIPLGRGQRELIIGDRGTGKTSIAVDTIINQRDSNVVCVYAAVGQKASSVNGVIDAIERHGPMDRCVFVIAEADSPAGLQWLAPYAACTIAEFFMKKGQDTLVVYDDLTKHAMVYRELSLLLRRPPGREAYPGDVFYIHSRLLERSAKLSAERGQGSLTALPIAETLEGGISAYIPTNLISITDGQIYLETELFNRGVRPAVDVGKSVSRVGGKSQAPAMERLSRSLRIDYAQFLELELFTRFGMTSDERTRKAIEHGRRIRAALSQPRAAPMSLSTQVALLLAVQSGLLDEITVEQIAEFKARLPGWIAKRCARAVERIDQTGDMDDDQESALKASMAGLAATLAPAAPVLAEPS